MNAYSETQTRRTGAKAPGGRSSGATRTDLAREARVPAADSRGFGQRLHRLTVFVRYENVIRLLGFLGYQLE
jgi:hypothetical protein